MRRLFLFAVLTLFSLGATSLHAQTTVNSDGVSVRNSAPANVFFMFPTSGGSNVTEIQFGCTDSSVNHNYVYVYEEQSNGFITTHPFAVTVSCTIDYQYAYGRVVSMTGSLSGPITVTTADHTITIDSAAWTAAYKSGRTGYYWSATGGSAQITIQ